MKFLPLFFSCCLLSGMAFSQEKNHTNLGQVPALITDSTSYNPLSPIEAWVILKKGTERPFTGAFHDQKEQGIYLCKQCNNPLFQASDKFDSGTGWPSFDDAIEGGVKELPDVDGHRTEIVCSNCDGHLGHVFYGEGFTLKQTRHCVNSVSLEFYSKQKKQESIKK